MAMNYNAVIQGSSKDGARSWQNLTAWMEVHQLTSWLTPAAENS